MSTVDVLLPLAAVVAAFTATYFFCMRPMRRGGHCSMSPVSQQQNQQAQRLEHDLRVAREELADLKRQRAESTGTVHSS